MVFILFEFGAKRPDVDKLPRSLILDRLAAFRQASFTRCESARRCAHHLFIHARAPFAVTLRAHAGPQWLEQFRIRVDLFTKRINHGIDERVAELMPNEVLEALGIAEHRSAVGGAAVSVRFEEVQPVDLDQMLGGLLELEPSETDHRLVVLSWSLWEARPRRWRTHRQVLPVVYEIKPTAWTMIADAVGLPLGAAASLTEHPRRA